MDGKERSALKYIDFSLIVIYCVPLLRVIQCVLAIRPNLRFTLFFQAAHSTRIASIPHGSSHTIRIQMNLLNVYLSNFIFYTAVLLALRAPRSIHRNRRVWHSAEVCNGTKIYYHILFEGSSYLVKQLKMIQYTTYT